MRQYHVKITNAALEDMENIYLYIAQQLMEPDHALGQYNRIAGAILKLKDFPERFCLLESEPWHSMKMHRMNVDNYSVFYVIHQNVVFVTDVLYSASDIENRLRGI